MIARYYSPIYSATLTHPNNIYCSNLVRMQTLGQCLCANRNTEYSLRIRCMPFESLAEHIGPSCVSHDIVYYTLCVANAFPL